MGKTRTVTEDTRTVGRAASSFDVHVPLERWPKGRYVDLPERGGRMFVRELAGPAGAPTVVLLHGWTATGGLNWAGSMREMAKHFNVIAVDQRGHGRGIRGHGPFSLEACADDIAGRGGLLDALGLDGAILAGYSMGGPIAQLAAHRHPARVDGIVLCATAARFPESRPIAPTLQAGLGLLGLVPPALLRPVPLPSKVADLPVVNALDDLRHNDPRALLQAGAALTRFDSRPWLGELRCPAASVLTTADLLVPVETQRELATLTKAPVFTVGSVSGHLVAGVNVREFTDQLVAATRDVARRALRTRRLGRADLALSA